MRIRGCIVWVHRNWWIKNVVEFLPLKRIHALRISFFREKKSRCCQRLIRSQLGYCIIARLCKRKRFRGSNKGGSKSLPTSSSRATKDAKESQRGSQVSQMSKEMRKMALNILCLYVVKTSQRLTLQGHCLIIE